MCGAEVVSSPDSELGVSMRHRPAAVRAVATCDRIRSMKRSNDL